MKGHEGIICVHVTLWKQNCVRPIKSNNKRNVRPFGHLGLNPQRRIIGIGTYYYTVLLSGLAPTVHCDRAHFDPDRSFLSATQNFRFSFFLIRGSAKRNTSSPPPPPSYHTYNWNLMDYKHRFRFFCCPHCVRLTLCPFVHPLLCGTDCYKHGSPPSPSRTHSLFLCRSPFTVVAISYSFFFFFFFLCLHAEVLYVYCVYGNTFSSFFLETGALLCCKRLGRCKPLAHTFKRRFSERR